MKSNVFCMVLSPEAGNGEPGESAVIALPIQQLQRILGGVQAGRYVIATCKHCSNPTISHPDSGSPGCIACGSLTWLEAMGRTPTKTEDQQS